VTYPRFVLRRSEAYQSERARRASQSESAARATALVERIHATMRRWDTMWGALGGYYERQSHREQGRSQSVTTKV